jgi:glucose uptake protein GlcU
MIQKKEDQMINYIQLALGLAAVVCIFIGLFTTIRSLDKNDSSKKISKETVIKSTILVTIGLLLYSGVKTCSNLMTPEAKDYDILVIYLASVTEVAKFFGFLIFIPLLIKVIAPKTPVKKQNGEDS